MTPEAFDWHILLPALLAGLLVLATHVPLGAQVLERGIVFIDLAAFVSSRPIRWAWSRRAGRCRFRRWRQLYSVPWFLPGPSAAGPTSRRP
jgi:hypothetical protein